MTPAGILVVVLVAEAVLLTVGVGALVCHVAYRRFRAARLGPRVRAARTTVAAVLAGGGPVPDLPRLPPAETVRVLAEATGSMDTATRRRLAALPACRDLTARAGRWCAGGRWPLRLRGVRLLTILGTGRDTVPPLLQDPHPEVRAAAAAWTAQHPTPAGTGGLLGMLDDDALCCRLAAEAALIRLGRRALGPVAEHLSDVEPRALPATLAVAARLSDPSLRAPALIHRGHPDPAVRAAVAGVLSSLGGAASVEALEDLLEEPAATVRAAAAAGLGSLGHWPSAPRLADRLTDPEPEVRRAAGLALRRLGGPGRLCLQRAMRGPSLLAADTARQVLALSEQAPVQREPR